MLTISKNGQTMDLSESDIHDMLAAFEYAFQDESNKPTKTFGCVSVQANFSGSQGSRPQMNDQNWLLTEC